MNLYGTNNNDCINNVDYLGMWTDPKRDPDQPRANVDGCEGDTVQTLADKIGLNAEEFKKWMRSEDGKPLPSSTSDKIKGKRTFSVPNTAYIDAAIVVAISFAGNEAYNYAIDVSTEWNTEGLDLIVNMDPWAEDSTAIMADLTDGNLYKFLYIGHGNPDNGGMTRLAKNSSGGTDLWPGKYTQFGIKELILFGCNTALGTTGWQQNVSKNGVLWVVQGDIDSTSTVTGSTSGQLQPFQGASNH